MKTPKKIQRLIMHHILGDSTPAQDNELRTWRASSPDHEAAFRQLGTREQMLKSLLRMEESKDLVWEKIRYQYPVTQNAEPKNYERNVVRKNSWWIAAAAVLLVIAGTYFFYYAEQIRPGIQQALFFSYRGYFLGTKGITAPAMQLSDEVRVEDRPRGERVLVAINHFLAPDSAYEKIITPTASRFGLEIPGVGAFRLNAESEIRYPAKFNRDSVHLELKGEVYADLANNPGRQLFLAAGGLTLQTSDASLDIQAYPSEPVRVTLLRGALDIHKYPDTTQTHQVITLKPGEQLLYQNGILQVTRADTIAAAAWVNGRIYYHPENIQVIMRSLSRWYNFDYQIDPAVAGRSFNLDLSREAPIQSVLDQLKAQGIQYRMRNSHITFKP